MAILDNLVAHWKLEETSGTRADAHTGGLDLTDNNTVTYAAGKIGTNAADFEDANSESLSRADAAAISCGTDTAWTIAAWVYCDELPDSRAILTKSNSSFTTARWCYGLATDATYHPLARAGNNSSSAAAVWGSALTTGQWYFIVAWHDPVADVVGISVDNGTAVTTAWTGGTYDNAYALVLAGFSGLSTNFFNGRMDSVSLWFRTLTSDERTTLYNSGSGLDYPFSAGTTYEAAGALSAQSALTGVTDVILQGVGALAAAASLVAAPLVELPTAGTLSAQVALSAVATTERPAVGALASQTSISGSPWLELPASGLLAAQSALTSSEEVIPAGTVTYQESGLLASQSALSGSPLIELSAVGVLSSASALSPSPTAHLEAVGALSAQSTLTSTEEVQPAGSIVEEASGILSAQSSLSVDFTGQTVNVWVRSFTDTVFAVPLRATTWQADPS